jgi:formamidopyrimidine-DNA glycosylase
MPELPDVETVRRTLHRSIVGRRIARVTVLSPSTIRVPAPRLFARRLRGRKIEAVHRRGKYLLIGVERAATLLVHLRMTGDFVVVPRTTPREPHTRVVFSLNGDELRFIDQRRFGHMDLLPTAELRTSALARLGVEPLDRGFTPAEFRRRLGGRHGALKALLLRQDVIAGIGNLYADEILFQARLHPARRADSLRPREVTRLYGAVRSVLRRATTALSRYGRAVGALLAARRPGGACPRCRRPLTARPIAGRTTFFCASCQR